MKKILALALLTSLICITTISSHAVVPPTQTEEKGYISINATADKDLAPDVAELSIVIETSDARSMQKAAAANKEISDKVYAALKSLVNTTNGDYVKTSNFNASPEYKYSNSKSTLSRYRVTNNVLVKTKSIDKVGEMIDKSISLGAKNVGNLTFSVSNYDSEFEELISNASKKAYSQAQTALKASQANIAGVKSMSINGSGNRARAPQYMMMADKSMAYEEAAVADEVSYTVIEPGSIKINVNLNAVYFVK